MKLKPTLKSRALRQVTARDFSGGLNLVDSEFNLSSKYAVAGYNMVPNDNGDLQVRWGTRQFALLDAALTGSIVALEYYYSYLIAVDNTGRIAAVNASGVVTAIWNSTIASALPGSPTGWGATSSANFTQFLGSLIIVNGTDKPIIVNNSLTVSYLQDLGSGSNINTPIGKLVITHSNYVVIAGNPSKPGRVYISNAGTSGTWPGDAIPNDAITFDVDKYAPDPTGEITGLASFRDRLVVFFAKYIVTVRLGVYSSAVTPVHTPTIDDVIASYGAVSQRSIANLGDQLVFMDFTGVSSIKQQTFSTQLVPARISALVDIDIQRALTRQSRTSLQNACYAVYDRRESRLMFFVPVVASDTSTEDMKVYTATIRAGKPPSWAVYTKWNYRAGAVSSEGRVFFAITRAVYLHGSRYEPILSDYETTRAFDGPTLEKNSVFVNGVLCDKNALGQGIPFYHELPYNDLKDRTLWKSLHYVTMDVQGGSAFTLDLHVDNLKNKNTSVGDPWSDGTFFSDGLGWEAFNASTPYASMDFIGSDRVNFTLSPTLPTPARLTDDMRLYAMYSRFRLFKLVFRGTSYSHLRIVGMSIYTTQGSIY